MGVVQTEDQNLTVIADIKQGNAGGIVLKTPKATSQGGLYFKDEGLLGLTGDFVSKTESVREGNNTKSQSIMALTVEPEKADSVLRYISQKWGVGATSHKNVAREILGQVLPSWEPCNAINPDVERVPVSRTSQIRSSTRNDLQRVFDANSASKLEISDSQEFTLESGVIEDNIPVKQPSVSPDTGKDKLPGLPAIAGLNPILGTPATITKTPLGLHTPQPGKHIASESKQHGSAEKNVAKLLHQAGLAAEILKGEDFHLKVKNEPYIPLSIERQGPELYLTHFLEDGSGDLFIDSEMVFNIFPTGQLSLTETAVQNPLTGGEYRRNDKQFAKTFSNNLLEQGFAPAALRLQEKQQSSGSLQTESLLVTSPDATKEVAHKLAEVFDGEVVEDFTSVQSLIPESEQLASTPLATRSEHPGSSKPLVAQETQLSLFELGLNNTNGYTQSDPPFPTVLPQASNQTSTEIPATQPAVQALTQNSALPSLNDIPVVAQEVTQAPVAKSDLLSNIQQPKPASNQNIASVRTQYTGTEHSESFSERANQVRDIDLETVALDLGLERDRHDKHKWRGSDQIISINGSKFYDHLNQKGSGGAINLVMHVQDYQYKEAVEWLSEQSATPQVRSDRSPVRVHEPVTNDEPKYLALPVKDETKWSDVQAYLVETRGLPEPLVHNAHQLGLVYADPQRNAVFLRHTQDAWERQEMTGASLRGTWGEFHGLSPGSDKEKGWFWFSLGKGEVQRVVLVESAIDALSFAALDKTNYQENKTVYLSTDGAGAIPIKDLQAVVERGGQVIVGFDADRSGEQMAWQVAQSLPKVTRLQPSCGKDWNEQLLGNDKSSISVDTPVEWPRIAKALGKPENYVNRVTEVIAAFKSGQPLSEKATTALQGDLNAYKQSINSLWKWHNTANALGKSSQYLNRISEVALAFNADKPSPLSTEAVTTMQRDLNIHHVVNTSQKVLQHLGKPTGNTNGELVFRGKNFYQVQGVLHDFRLECHNRGLILSVSHGQVQKSDLTNEDFERFRVLGQKLEVDVVKSREALVAKKLNKNCDLEVGN